MMPKMRLLEATSPFLPMLPLLSSTISTTPMTGVALLLLTEVATHLAGTAPLNAALDLASSLEKTPPTHSPAVLSQEKQTTLEAGSLLSALVLTLPRTILALLALIMARINLLISSGVDYKKPLSFCFFSIVYNIIVSL